MKIDLTEHEMELIINWYWCAKSKSQTRKDDYNLKNKLEDSLNYDKPTEDDEKKDI